MFWLVEKTGPDRQVWGPYQTFGAAKAEAGVRHAVVRGSGLADGQVMTQGALRHALEAGRVWAVDGSQWLA